MKMTSLVLAAAVTLIGLNGGCSSTSSKPVYDAAETGRIIHEERGEILGVREVTIKPSDIGILRGGGGMGRTIGSAVGSGLLTGNMRRAEDAVGGAIGGEIGAGFDTKAGEEITIRLKSDEIVIVVQERGDSPLAAGQRVKVLTGSSSSRSMGAIGILMGGSAGGSVRVVPEDFFVAENTRAPEDRAERKQAGLANR